MSVRYPAPPPHDPSTDRYWEMFKWAVEEAHKPHRTYGPHEVLDEWQPWSPAKGYFARHYRISTTDFFEGSPCWIWTGSLTKTGYSQVWRGKLMKLDSRPKRTTGHRLSFEIWIGPVPPGLEIDHRCNRRNCVAPAHLRAVTHLENQQSAAIRRKEKIRGIR